MVQAHRSHLRGGLFVIHRELIAQVIEPIAEPRNHSPVRAPEVERAVVIAPDREPALVQQRVMVRAQQREFARLVSPPSAQW